MRCGASATYMRLELAQPLDLDASIAQMQGVVSSTTTTQRALARGNLRRKDVCIKSMQQQKPPSHDALTIPQVDCLFIVPRQFLLPSLLQHSNLLCMQGS